jgi:chromosome partitioning protein
MPLKLATATCAGFSFAALHNLSIAVKSNTFTLLPYHSITLTLNHMKVITLASQKGGCGKSSLAISLAVLAAGNSKHIIILETDEQKTVRDWRKERKGDQPEVRYARCHELTDKLNLIAMEGIDFVFIDTPGQEHPTIATAIQNSALTLIPCRPALADIRATQVTASAARTLKRHYAFVLTQVPTRGTRADETAGVLAEFGEVAPVRIAQRVAWQDSYAANQGLSEYERDSSATRELIALWRWIGARLKGFNNA